MTEEVTGIDLIRLQLRLSSGECVAEAVGDVQFCGTAVQARVSATSAAPIAAFVPPEGVRVDSAAMAGLPPSAAFDPLLCKLIAHRPSVEAALAACAAAVDELVVSGPTTNAAESAALLTSPDLVQNLSTRLVGDLRAAAAPESEPEFESDGRVAAPRNGTVVEVLVAVGDAIAPGDALCALSAMKMEEVVRSPCGGTVASVHVAAGAAVASGDVLVTVAEGGDAAAHGEAAPSPWAHELEQLARMKTAAAELGGEAGVERQKSHGKLTVRERIEALLDAGSAFAELGAVTGKATWDLEANTLKRLSPHSFVGGRGDVGGRPVWVGADDFTLRAGHSEGSASLVMGLARKQGSVEARARAERRPLVRLLDGSSGGGSVATIFELGYNYVPPLLGFEHKIAALGEIPVCAALLGPVVGFGAARAVTSHYSVMVEGISSLFVAGPPVVAGATGERPTKDELGGPLIHGTNGSVDNVVATEAEALASVAEFLSFLPPSAYETPPVAATSDPADRRDPELDSAIPRRRKEVYDARAVVRRVVDADTAPFELGAGWGQSIVTSLARIDGRPVGVLATDSRHAGGALTADACNKLRRFIQMCDVFNVPVVSFVDQPGFAVGTSAEEESTIRAGAQAIAALYQLQSGYFCVITRRCYGVGGAFLADCGAAHDMGVHNRVAWPSAETGSLPLDGGIEAAFKKQIAAAPDPEAALVELRLTLEALRSPLRTAAAFGIEDVIAPRDTRPILAGWVADQYRKNEQTGLGPKPGRYMP